MELVPPASWRLLMVTPRHPLTAAIATYSNAVNLKKKLCGPCCSALDWAKLGTDSFGFRLYENSCLILNCDSKFYTL